MRIVAFGLLTLAVFSPIDTAGAVLRVEKDGSGDYSVIQDAVDAAQNGDTILVGPGRFTETHHFNYYGTPIQVCVTIVKSLTIQGSGRGVSFIEPIVEGKNQSDPGGLASRSSGIELTLSDLSFANCPGNAVLFDMETAGGRLVVERVDFDNCFDGVNIDGTTNSRVSDCFFDTFLSEGCKGWYAEGLEIEDCHFVNGGIKILGLTAGSHNISGCLFEGSWVGISLVDCGTTQVAHCQFVDCGNKGFAISGTQGVSVNDVEITGDSPAGLVLSANDNLEVRNSLFHVTGASVGYIAPSPGMVFEDNHVLFYPESFSVWMDDIFSGPDLVVDFTNNYWGTNDPEEVAASIFDGNDDPDVHLFVDFEPMAGGPVGTSRTTMGGVKALFR